MSVLVLVVVLSVWPVLSVRAHMEDARLRIGKK